MIEVQVLIEGAVLKGSEAGTTVGAPSVVLVLSGIHRILVDTGLFVAGYRFDLVSRLNQNGVKTTDIDTIIYTHLHEDHCQNTVLFPNAKIYVGADELVWLEREIPNPIAAALLPNDRDKVIVTNDLVLEEGVRIITTPGHTDGHLSVVVDTDKERIVIAGDAIGWKKYWDEWIPAPIVSNTKAYLESMDKIKQLKPDWIIPGHEGAFLCNGRKGGSKLK